MPSVSPSISLCIARMSFAKQLQLTPVSVAKTKPTYTRRSSTGGYTTLLLLIISILLSFTELTRWYAGHEIHLFSVEKGVSRTLQINLDIVIPMLCNDLHINVQDASGDRILAGDMLQRDGTAWEMWGQGGRRLESGDMAREMEEDTHVGHVLGEVRAGKKVFRRTPKVGRGMEAKACRIYGSLEGNKVQGDFHITARGHGYMEFGQHLDHQGISPFPFPPFYPFHRNSFANVPSQPSTSPTQSTNFPSGPSTQPSSTHSTKPMQRHQLTSINTNTTSPSSRRSTHVRHRHRPPPPYPPQSSRTSTR